MRVSRTAGIMIAVGMVVAICIGLGYALSPLYGYSYSENNTTGVSEKTVDIYVNDNGNYVPLTTNMVFPTYDPDEENWIQISGDYKVIMKDGGDITSGKVRLWCDMHYDASWALIDSMYIEFDEIVDENTQPVKYYFGVADYNNEKKSGVPTDAITLDGDATFRIYVKFSNDDMDAIYPYMAKKSVNEALNTVDIDNPSISARMALSSKSGDSTEA